MRHLLTRDRDSRLPSPVGLRATLESIRTGRGLRGADEVDGNRSVAFTGFVNISRNPDDEWLGTGITETLTTDAAQLEGVSVVPRERVSETLKTLPRTPTCRTSGSFFRPPGICGRGGS